MSCHASPYGPCGPARTTWPGERPVHLPPSRHIVVTLPNHGVLFLVTSSLTARGTNHLVTRRRPRAIAPVRVPARTNAKMFSPLGWRATLVTRPSVTGGTACVSGVRRRE